MIGVKSETVELYVWPSVVVDVMVVVKSYGGGIGSRLVSELKRRLRLKIDVKSLHSLILFVTGKEA